MTTARRGQANVCARRTAADRRKPSGSGFVSLKAGRHGTTWGNKGGAAISTVTILSAAGVGRIYRGEAISTVG